jgi:hypothetical protein
VRVLLIRYDPALAFIGQVPVFYWGFNGKNGKQADSRFVAVKKTALQGDL